MSFILWFVFCLKPEREEKSRPPMPAALGSLAGR
jgi:hypothetical protein